MNIILLKLAVFFFTATLLFTGCAGGGSNDDALEDDFTPIDRALYGKWRYIDTGEELLILSDTKITYTIENADLLKIEDRDTRRYVMRASIANANITGQILVDDSSSLAPSRAFSKIGGIEIVLTNMNDSSLLANATTDADGRFEDSSHPSGTTVEITVDDNGKILRTEVPINSGQIDLGLFVLRDINDYNFKTSLEVSDEFIYADGGSKSGNLLIKNIGNIEGTDVSYKIFYKGIEISRGISGTVLSGETKTIPVSFGVDTIASNDSTIVFDVNMSDSNGKTWTDSTHLKVYRDNFDVNIRSAGAAIKGYIVLPNGNVKNINISGTGTINLPTIDEAYALIISNPDTSSDLNVYTLGVGVSAPEIDPNFINTAAHEPNNAKADASTLGENESTTSYLGYGDIDYWLISSPVYDPNKDTDGDGVIDSSDAFITDAAASVDSDGDGYPNSWNTGKSEADSTTGLTLDLYPDDATKWNDLSNATLINPMELNQSIATNAAYDMESFMIGTDTYLAVANRYNETTNNINSNIYKWSGTQFVEIQAIATNGAMNLESFTIGTDTYLAVANGSNGTTNNIDSKIYKWSGTQFLEIQAIATNGASSFESFIIGSDTYLAVANYYNDITRNIDFKIYKWSGTQFVETQSIATNGPYDLESFTIGIDTYLAVANRYNDTTHNINSIIYKWNGTQFVETQSIATNGASDWESFTIGTDTYLALANNYNDTTHNINSIIYKWSGTQFVEIQSIATNGAFDWKSFTVGVDIYLAVANYENDATFNLNSKIYKWSGTQFEEVQSIATNGALDWESFTIGTDTYMAVANHYNDSTYNIDSKIYRIGSIIP